MAVWRGLNGVEVEAIVLDHRPCYRVTQAMRHGRRYWVADCVDLDELARLVDLADLVEVVDLSSRHLA